MVLPSSALRKPEEGSPRPLLSVLCVRWFDYWSIRWCSDFCVTSDRMLQDIFDGPCGPQDVLPGEHEVYTAFIQRSEELDQLSAQWVQLALKGVHRTAWYFLWPTASVPGGWLKAGSVSELDFFALAGRMERTGVRSCWPHPSQLYRLLCGKLWVPQMCLNTSYHVPPTTRVHFQEFATDPLAAARGAIQRLSQLQRELWGGEPQAPTQFRGVVKLGFSWQGKDVKPFVGEAALADALRGLLLQKGSRQLICLVQQMVPAVACEVRALMFRDAAGGGTDGSGYVGRKIYMRLWDKEDKYHDLGVDGFSLASHVMVHSEDAPEAFFGGSATVRDQVEQQVDLLVRRWLLWYGTECEELPPQTRLDFLVSLAQPDQPRVWTCEVTECGSSLCGLRHAARNAAALNFAMRHDTSGRFPRPLPKLEWKDR